MPDGIEAQIVAALDAAAKRLGKKNSVTVVEAHGILDLPPAASGRRYELLLNEETVRFTNLDDLAAELELQGMVVWADEGGNLFLADYVNQDPKTKKETYARWQTATGQWASIVQPPRGFGAQAAPTAEYPTAAEAQASIDANPDLQAAGAQVEVTPKGTYKVTFPGEQPLAGPQFTVGEDGNVYRRDVAGGAWKLVEAQDVPSLDDEIDRLILEGTPEAMAEASRLYQAKQRVTGAAEASQQAALEKQQAQATQRFNQALQLVDLAQNDPARLDMVLKLLQQSGLWPFDGSMDPLQAVQQQVQQAPGFVQGFGSQAQRQAAVEENIRRQETGQPPITLGQVGQMPTGNFQPPSEQGQQVPPYLGGIMEGQGIPGTQPSPAFSEAALQYGPGLSQLLESGQITQEQAEVLWAEFVRQWGQQGLGPEPATVETAGGTFPVTYGPGFSPKEPASFRGPARGGVENYYGGWVDHPTLGRVPVGAAQAYEAQQKELEALTPGSPYYGAITLDPASLKQGTPISELPSVRDVLGRQFKVSPQQEFTYLGGGPRAGGMPPTTTGNKFVDWLKVIQDQAKERARAEAQKSNRLGGTFGRPVAGGSVRYG